VHPQPASVCTEAEAAVWQPERLTSSSAPIVLFDTLDNFSRRHNAIVYCSESGDNAIGGRSFEVADGFGVSKLRNQLVAMIEKFAQ
jgi:hypothetical protein